MKNVAYQPKIFTSRKPIKSGSEIMSDGFLFMKCTCGYSSWSVKVLVICPKCKRKNKATTRGDLTDWFEKSVGLVGDENEQPNSKASA